jgi:hypothetical protein
VNANASDWKVPIAVGALAGAAGALLFLAGLRGQPSGTFFLVAAPLSLFLAGLGWGLPALAIAIGGGAGLLAGTGGTGPAIVFCAFAAAAPALVCYIALARPGTATPYPNLTATAAPPGHILIALAALGAIMIVGGLAAAQSAGGLSTLVDHTLGTTNADVAMAQRELAAKGIRMDRAQMAELLSLALPPAFAAGWLILSVCNAIVAEEILARSGRALRPAPAYSMLRLPRSFLLAPIIAGGLCFAPGWIEGVGLALVALTAVVYFFLGLAVIHVISRRLPARPFALALIYLCLILFAWPALILALLGLIDQWGDLRGRALHDEREIK